jgi:hypothetical protein
MRRLLCTALRCHTGHRQAPDKPGLKFQKFQLTQIVCLHTLGPTSTLIRVRPHALIIRSFGWHRPGGHADEAYARLLEHQLSGADVSPGTSPVLGAASTPDAPLSPLFYGESSLVHLVSPLHLDRRSRPGHDPHRRLLSRTSMGSTTR